MANIREYDDANAGLQPSTLGLSAFARVGAHEAEAGQREGASLNRGFQAVGDVVANYEAHQEISTGAVAFSSLFNKLSQDQKDFFSNADPNDPNVGQKFVEGSVNPAIEDFGGRFKTEAGQNWALEHGDTMRQHFTEAANADQATMAGAAVQRNVTQTVNNFANGAMNNPASLDYAMMSWQSSIDNIIKTSPNLSTDQIAKLKGEITESGSEQIVKAGLVGAIEKSDDPEKTADWLLNDPRYSKYVKGDEIKSLATYAKQLKTADARDKLAIEAEQRRVEQQASDDEVGKIQAGLYDPNSGEFKPAADITRQILQDKTIKPSSKGALLSMINGLQKEGSAEADSPGLVNDLLKRTSDPNSPLTIDEVLSYVGKNNPTGKELTQSSANFILGAIKKGDPSGTTKLFTDYVDQGVHQLNPKQMFGGAIADPDAQNAADSFAAAAQLKFNQIVKAGGDPTDALTPGSPNFIFTPDYIKSFQAKAVGTTNADATIKGITDLSGTNGSMAGAGPSGIRGLGVLKPSIIGRTKGGGITATDVTEPATKISLDAAGSDVGGGVGNLLNVIAKGEAHSYNTVFGGKENPGITKMTIDQVLADQRARIHAGAASSATGRYQFLHKTLASLKKEMGLSGNEVFDEKMQDRLAEQLLERRGLSKFRSGQISAATFGNNLAREWASLPVISGPHAGRSFYAGDGLNKSSHNPQAILAALQGVNSADQPASKDKALSDILFGNGGL